MKIQDIKTVACLGAGTMGHGVAFLAARAGYEVRLYARTKDSLDRGLADIDRVLCLFEDNALMPRGKRDDLFGRISCFTSVAEATKGVDLVMESVIEDLAVKQDVFAEAEANCRPGALLATNTSGLSLSGILKKLKAPQFFLGIHFFTPAYLMPVVEVCPTDRTLPEMRALGAAWVESLGNVPVVLEKEVPGFILNRIQSACLREALHIVEQGWASAETVDRAIALSLGRRYSVTGPMESADMGGLDVLGSMLESLSPTLGARTDAGPVMEKAMKRGNFGLKTGRGIYDWPPERVKERQRAREESLIAFLREDQAKKGT